MSDTNLVTVYHGTTALFDKIDVSKGKPYKDFGKGFYVTKSKSHAEKLALRNKKIAMEKSETHVEAYLYTYEMQKNNFSDFHIKIFLEADLAWVQFVLANRKVRNRTHDYDIVTGPTANDDTMVVINAYLDGLYGELGSENALSTLLKNIEAEKLPEQIYFGSNKAVFLLSQMGKAEKL